jgi:molybdopterin molybdotransferase
MIDIEHALGLLAEEVRALDAVEVDLGTAQGHALAETVASPAAFPPTDRSAMDGYAVRAADAGQPDCQLDVVGELRAGQSPAGLRVGAGQAVRIMTGGVLPAGADAVVMIEHTALSGSRITLHEPVRPGQHVRRRGEELQRGATVIGMGSPIHAPEVAALAALGRTRVKVFRAPSVHVLSTGDELVEPEQQPQDHQVRNSNASSLQAQLRQLGISADYLGIAADERGRLDTLVRRGLSGDLLLVSGGVSVGTHDLVGQTLAAGGMQTLFHGVAIKPGKPVLAGRSGRCLVFGLPGNPVSSFTCFLLLVAPAIRRMMGQRRWQNEPVVARVQAPIRQRPAPRTTYHLARLVAERGHFAAVVVPSSGSGDVFAPVRANAFVITPPGTGNVEAGTELAALPWKDFELR